MGSKYINIKMPVMLFSNIPWTKFLSDINRQVKRQIKMKLYIVFVLVLFTASGCIGLSPRSGDMNNIDKTAQVSHVKEHAKFKGASLKVYPPGYKSESLKHGAGTSNTNNGNLSNHTNILHANTSQGKAQTSPVEILKAHSDIDKVKSKGHFKDNAFKNPIGSTLSKGTENLNNSHNVKRQYPGGSLADLSGYKPSQIVSTHVSFSKKYQKDGEKKHHVELAFDNADIYQVLDATLFGIYGVNYIVDPHIKAKVTFHFSGDYSKDEFVELLNNVLQMDNLSIVKGPGNMFKVVMKNASSAFGNIQAEVSSSASSAGDITRVFRLRYLSSGAASQMIRGFVSRGASVLAENMGNSIIVTDSRTNIDKVARILALMDIPYFRNIHWRLIPLKQVKASELNREISQILRTGGLFNRAGINQGSYAIVPIKSLNALLVVSKWPEIISLVEKWASAMDYNDTGTGTGVFVYFVQNGKADDLANVLKQLYGGKQSETAPKRVKIVKSNKASKTNNRTIVSGELSGNVEIIPDKINNAIVIKANASDYRLIKSVLKQLDIVPRQVLINVVVAEVTLTKKTEYGLQWFFTNNVGTYKAVAMLDKEKSKFASTTRLGDLSGFSYGIFNSTNVLRTLIRALGNNSDVNILSSPNVLAVNNKEADIEVSEEVPTITGSVTDATGTGVTNTIQYKKTGIILKVTPHINSRGLVKLDLEQEVSAPGEYDARLNNYSFLTRKATTSAVVEDGQTMILGGMMKTNVNHSKIGIPLLDDIPIIGNLFSSTTKSRTKTELIFLITTHVIYNRADADRITAEFSKRIAGVKKLIESSKK